MSRLFPVASVDFDTLNEVIFVSSICVCSSHLVSIDTQTSPPTLLFCFRRFGVFTDVFFYENDHKSKKQSRRNTLFYACHIKYNRRWFFNYMWHLFEDKGVTRRVKGLWVHDVLLWTPGSVFNSLTVQRNKFLHVIPVEQLSGSVYPRTDGRGKKIPVWEYSGFRTTRIHRLWQQLCVRADTHQCLCVGDVDRIVICMSRRCTSGCN